MSYKNVPTCGDYGGKTSAGNPCKNEAGKETDHPGEGKCKHHGGCSKGQPIKTGKYVKVTCRQLKTRIEKHLQNPNPLDLTPELALLRSLIDYFKDKLADAQADPKRTDAETFLLLVQGVQKVADTISKIQSRELLTAAEMTLVLAVLSTVLREEVTDGHVLKKILSKLRSRLQLPELIGRADILGE